MIWQTDFKKIKPGVPVLIKTTLGQYMAGVFERTLKGVLRFVDSSGAWNIDITAIERFVEIE